MGRFLEKNSSIQWDSAVASFLEEAASTRARLTQKHRGVGVDGRGIGAKSQSSNLVKSEESL